MLGVQPGLILLATALLVPVIALGAWAALLWPHTPPGFSLPINPLDLPYLWSMIVAGTAAVVAGAAIAIDVKRNPWSRVAHYVRRAIHASAEQRARLFDAALLGDPGVPHGASANDAEPPTAPASGAAPPTALDAGATSR